MIKAHSFFLGEEISGSETSDSEEEDEDGEIGEEKRKKRRGKAVEIPISATTLLLPTSWGRKCSQSQAGTRGVVEMPYAAAIIMPLLETKPFGAVSADGQLQTCSTCFHLGSCACRDIILCGGSLGAARWLRMACGGVELPLLTEVGGRKHQRSFVGRCGFYSHGYDWRGILAVV